MQMNISKCFLCTGAALLLAVGLAACDKQQPAESVSKSMNQATGKAEPMQPGAMDQGSMQHDIKGPASMQPGAMDQASVQSDEQGGDIDEASKVLLAQGDTAVKILDDAAITAKVKATILAEPGLEVMQIKVDTVHGVTTLSGTADSQQSIARAGEIAGTVEGVARVENQLALTSTR
jgi:hyperosmotically inducible protein